uniref:Uncharacterized protein n=1 Tax=Vitis vinifera TaxID=29760 RepID=A5BI52_VITVI|nr:hypothetical protein VITISV_002218 [Vitis vinifera]
MARPWACLRHTTRLKYTHMGFTTCVVCTPWPQRHGAWYGLPPPRAGTRAPKPCVVSKLMKPWAQCHGLMAPIADLHSTRAQCPMHQEGLAMDAMSWLVAGKLGSKQQAQAIGT